MVLFISQNVEYKKQNTTIKESTIRNDGYIWVLNINGGNKMCH